MNGKKLELTKTTGGKLIMNNKNKFDLGKSLLFEYQNNKKFKDIWDYLNLKRKAEKLKKNLIPKKTKNENNL